MKLLETDDNKTEHEYYAPYTSIIQSSGMGKTRMLEILSKDAKFCVVYCNLNDQETNSIPSPTSDFADFLLQNNLTRNQLEMRVYCYFSEFLTFIDRQLTKPVFSFFNDDQSIKTDVWNKIQEKCNANKNKTINDESKFMERNTTKKKNILIVFAFDEARSLVNKLTEESKLE